MKKCSKCGTNRPSSDFGPSKKTKSGLRSECNPCRLKYREARREELAAKSRDYYAANAERMREVNRAWLAANRERKREMDRVWYALNRERQAAKKRARYWADPKSNNAASKAWREANPEKAKASARRYRTENRDARRAADRAYYLANAEQIQENARRWKAANADRTRELSRLQARRRRMRRMGLPTFDVIDKDLRRLLAGPCMVPGCTSTDIQIDHVVPIARGGSHGIGNLQPLCGSHNRAKHSRTWMEFRLYLQMKDRMAA